MNLYCAEMPNAEPVSVDQGKTLSKADHSLLRNPTVLKNMLEIEGIYTVNCDYLTKVQNVITEENRKVLASWMSEVCEEQGCGEIVLPLAINYLDRFMSKIRVSKENYQLLGSVCLILASKLRQFRSFTIEQMVFYTDYTYTAKEFMNWELLVLNQLGWDISSVVANDFLDHILYRLPLSTQNADSVKKHAQVFITLSSTEYKYSQWKPSTLACASIASAAHGLCWMQKPWKTLDELLDILKDIVNIDKDHLHHCVEQIEDLVKVGLATLHQSEETVFKPSSKQIVTSTPSLTSLSTKYIELEEPFSPTQPETPTDLTDINF